MIAGLLLAACGRAAPLPFVEGPTDREARLPMMLAVHSLGTTPEDALALVEACHLPVRVVAPRGPTPWHDGYSWFPASFEAGGATLDEPGIREAAEDLAALAAWLPRHRPTAGDVVITGFSQGGILSFAVATSHPEVVGAAVPIAGALPAGLRPAAAPTDAPPIRAVHGEVDRVLPLGPTREAVDALAAAGFDVTLRPFPGVAHAVPRTMHDAVCAELARATSTRPER